MKALSNSIKVWIFLMTLSLAFMFVGFQLGGRVGLFLGLILGVGFHLLIFFYGQNQLLKTMQAEPVRGQDPWGLQEILAKYASLLGMPCPVLHIMDHPAATTFSLGHSWHRSAVCISTGLLRRLSRAEMEAVLAHQVCHIQRLDTFGFEVAHTLAYSIIGIGQILDRLLLWNQKKKPHVPSFRNLLSPVAWLVLRLAVRDKIYFENDDLTIALLKDRRLMAEALWKLDGMSHTSPLTPPPCSSHFFIVNPQGLQEKNWFLLTHPKIDIRVKRLIGYWPI